MKNKLFPVLLVVLFVAAVFAVPVFAQDVNPPPVVDAPVFDWAVISSALQTLITAFLVPIAGFVARWLFVKGSYQKALLRQEQQYGLELFIKTCVYAAEQINMNQFIDDKFTYVSARVENWLFDRGIIMDIEELRARIEAVVMEEFPNTKTEI